MGLGGSKPNSESAGAKEGTANGDHLVKNNADASGQVVAQENGNSQQKPRAPGQGLQKRRMSFYETVDASEVLPYLIIGKLAWPEVYKLA